MKTKKNVKVFTSEQDIDHILNFDPEVPETALPESSMQPAFLLPEALPPIPWPKGMAPKPQKPSKKPSADAPLPQADVLVVTWTVAEALALSDVLTPGYRSKTDWYPYTHNWKTKFLPNIKRGAPALEENRLGLWFPTIINGTKVICMKSELHFARDGAKMPIKDLWLQLIEEVNPKLVITTGTAGAIGKNTMLGDVVVSKKVRFDCKKTFKSNPFAQTEYACNSRIGTSQVAFANSNLMSITTSRLPAAARQSKITLQSIKPNTEIDVVTTDFFAFDDSTNYFGLQQLGSAVEMGDAVLGLACSGLKNAPAWMAIRNASDPQIDGSLPQKQQVSVAGRIYEKYGYWTTVNSAIACWAVICSQ